MRCLVTIPAVLLGMTFYQGSNPPDHSPKTGNANEKSEAEIKPLVPVSNSAHAAISKPQENSKQNGTANSDTGITHWFNYLNAAATTVGALFAILIWLVYRAMLRATKITERAWLVSDIGLIEETKTEGTYQVVVQIKNKGQTPAWVTAAGSKGQWASDQNPLPKTPKYDPMGPFTKEGQLLPPTAYFPQGFPLEKTRIDKAVKKELVLYIFGFVEYRDVYGDRHLTRYCYRAKPALDLNHPFPLDFYFDNPTDGYLKAT